MSRVQVAVVGATGLVGLELRKILQEPSWASRVKPLYFASSARPSEEVLDLAASKDQLSRCPYIINAASSEVALSLRHSLREGQTLIDNSSAFRLDPEVPLVVPEVNGALIEGADQVIANPNCTAILLCLALNAFKDVGLTRVQVSTYQAASGAGIKGLEELERQSRALALGEAIPAPEVFPFVLAGNVISHNTPIRPETEMGGGYNEEEWKVIEETRKILDIRHLPLSATCMRVPVKRAHVEAVSLDLKSELSLAEARERLSRSPGLKLVDDASRNHFPMPSEAEHQDLVLVGRLRKDPSLAKTLHLILAGDQLRKGAATSALQILDYKLQLAGGNA